MTTILSENQAAYVAAHSIDGQIDLELQNRDPRDVANVEFYKTFCRTIESTLTIIRRTVEETEKLQRKML